MPPPIAFSALQRDDLPAVLEIERRSFPAPWRDRLFVHEMGLEFSRLRVARSRRGELLGYACWWVVAGEGHILNLAVDPKRRQAGVGRALVEHILADCRAAGAELVGLEVRADNDAAAALYRSCGFHAVGQRRDYYGPGVDAVLMDRALAVGSVDHRGSEPS